MPAPFTPSNVLSVAPYGANGVSVTPSGTAFAPSAWVQVTAATTTPWVVAGVYVLPADINAADVEVEVGIGAAGFEIPVAGPFICRTGSSGATLFGHVDLLSPILFDRVPIGSRVAVRIRKSGTDTTAWRVKVAYYAGPLDGNFNVTATQLAVRYPASAASVQVTTPASAWGNSAYGALVTLPFTAIILGATIELNANGPRYEVDLSTGPAAAEIPIATLWENSGNVSDGLQWFPLKTPLGPITAGTRIACRARCDDASARDAFVSILVLPVPYASTVVETTLPLRVFPTATSLLALTAGSGVTPGSWVQVWAASPAITVTGFVVDSSSANARDIQLGIGAGGSEVVIASQRLENNPASQRMNGFWPTAIPIPAGTRVALRTRIAAVDAGLQYFEGSGGSDNTTPAVADAMQVAPVSVSSAITGVAVTPGDTWAWGAYVQLTAGEATPIGIYGLSVDQRRINEELEWEIAIGAASSEVPIATFGSFVRTVSLMRGQLELPAIRMIPASTRVAVRLRSESNGAFTGTHRATLQFYLGTGVVADPPGGGTPPVGTDPAAGISLCGAEIPMPWLTVQTDGGEKIYAGMDIALDTAHKEARVLGFGTITRALSSMDGALETATQTVELSDHDRTLRAAADAGTLMNKRVDTFISTKAGIIAAATPRRVFQGHIARYRALPNLRFRLELEDFFSALMNKVQGKKVVPQRTLTLADFPNLPPTLVGKSVPIAYGLLSDEDQGANALGVCPLLYVGQRVVAGFSAEAEEFLLCGHATPAWQSLFIPAGGGLSTGTAEPSRTKITTSIADVIFPGTPGWTTYMGGDLFVDYPGGRFSTCFMFGPRANLAKSGQVPLAANAPGIEDVGDGTGDLITSLPYQVLHLLTNFMLQNYTSGAWLPIPTVPVTSPYSRISTASFDVVQAHLEERIAPDGYLGAFMLGWQGQFHPWRDALKGALQSGGFNLGINKDGQIIAAVRDPDATLVTHWGDVLDILDGSFDSERDFPNLANRVPYRYAQRYLPPVASVTPDEGEFLPDSLKQEVRDWFGENTIESTASIANHASDGDDGVRVYPLDLPCVRDVATADNVAAQVLVERKDGPILATHAVTLCGTDVELGGRQTVTHFEGPMATGWIDRSTRVERMALDVDAMTQTFVARDLDAIVAD